MFFYLNFNVWLEMLQAMQILNGAPLWTAKERGRDLTLSRQTLVVFYVFLHCVHCYLVHISFQKWIVSFEIGANRNSCKDLLNDFTNLYFSIICNSEGIWFTIWCCINGHLSLNFKFIVEKMIGVFRLSLVFKHVCMTV